jgi:RNA polymerase sigma-70 factor (ECF subfamily)
LTEITPLLVVRAQTGDREALNQLLESLQAIFPAVLSSPLAALLESLPSSARAVVRMHYLDQLSLLEIAEALEIPVGTVKSRLAYGLRALRSQVER